MRGFSVAAGAVAVLVLQSVAPAQAAAPPAVSPAAATVADWKADRAYKTSWEEYQAMRAAAHGGLKMTWDKLPDWTGLWSHESGFAIDEDQKGQYATAPLTPAYKARYDEKLANIAKGIEWDPLSNCLPAGYPRWLVEPFLREFILRPEQAWLMTEQNEEIRRVYADGRGHVPDDEAYPLWEGDSIGFWDGDTLVVHTQSLKAGTYQRLQPEHSDKVTTVERWRRIGPGTIEALIAIYDPEGLTKPWRVRQTYSRVDTPNLRINHWSCEENNNVVKTDDGTSGFKLPGEAGYKDPNALGPAAPPPAGGK